MAGSTVAQNRGMSARLTNRRASSFSYTVRRKPAVRAKSAEQRKNVSPCHRYMRSPCATKASSSASMA